MKKILLAVAFATISTTAFAHGEHANYDVVVKNCPPGITVNSDDSTTIALPYPVIKWNPHQLFPFDISVKGLVLAKQRDVNNQPVPVKCGS